MGIPHLAHQLQPHGTKVLLSRTPTDAEHRTPAIIDGPSLAYQCFYVCLGRHSNARNSYEALPSYKELGEAAVSWLEQIEEFGLKVEAVFFDGLLPTSKKPTRLSRLKSYANQLVSFRAFNKDDFPPRLSHVQTSKLDVLSTVTLSTRLKALPAPPFLVPAVMEAVLSSRFKDVTSTIPGEADAYCAQHARLSGGTIFTSDSDLLVHDLGAAGKVILFRDVETIHLPSKGTCLKTQQYHPSAIAEKFNLSNLVRLAFFMSEDNHRSFSEAIKLAKERNPTSEEFDTFREQYASLPVLSTLAEQYLTSSDRQVFRVLSGLDPRVSELVHQISMNTAGTSTGERGLDMYLPFLLDDPTRTSAWRAGTDVRDCAYSMLRLLDPTVSIIDEYERKGTRVSDTAMDLLPLDEILERATAIHDSLAAALQSNQNAGLTQAGVWRALAANIVCQSNIETGKPPIPTTDLARLITGTTDGSLSWSFIHASAQLQAVLYSLRLLLQISNLVNAFLEETKDSPETRTILSTLSTTLESMPTLWELLDTQANVNADEVEAAQRVASEILHALGVEEQPNTSSAAKRKKKRKKKEEHAKETSPPAWRQNNMFGNLL